MISRKIKLKLWNAPGRGTYLRFLDMLTRILGRTPEPYATDPYLPAERRQPVESSEGILLDEQRDIAVGYELFHPQILSGRLPVVFLSLGMNFGENVFAPSMRYLAEHFAAHGYIVIHLWHDGSDAVFIPEPIDDQRELIRTIRMIYRTWSDEPDRFLDISFAIDMVEAWDRGGTSLAGHIDIGRIGMSGYSFGGRSAIVAIGEKVGPEPRSFKDDRIRAGILYSPTPSWPPGEARARLTDIDIPLLHMAGTRDRAYADPGIPEDKFGAFETISAPHQYALVLEGADHAVFSGERAGGTAMETDARQHQLIKSAALAFWDAHLKDDEAARRWLEDDFTRLLGREGKFSRK